MYTLSLVHNTAFPEPGEFFNNTKNGGVLTMSRLRREVLRASVEGLETFEDKKYRGWIHPYVLHDVLNDASFNGLTDIIARGEKKDKAFVSITLAGVEFISTTDVRVSTFIFGKNSDPLDLKLIYI